MVEVQSCPKCGALITRELERCRRCNTYLHGTALEGALITHLLPESLRARPGTATILLVTLLYYVMMVVLSAPVDTGAMIGFSGFTLIQLGATHGARMLLGEHWRYVTSVLAHHDLMHLAFNMWALSAAGPLVEELFDRKKMLLIYAVTGVLSMIVSFVWYVYVLRRTGYVSAGASGAVSGLVGAALFGARRRVLDGRGVARGMMMWSLSLVAWGFMMPGVNNAAHLGGWLAGALAGRFVPLGLAASVRANRALSVATLGVALVALGSVVMMLATLRGFPASLAHDEEPRRILGFSYSGGSSEADSDRVAIEAACLSQLEHRDTVPTEHGVHDCQLYTRVAAWYPGAYFVMADVLSRVGRGREAGRYLDVAQRLSADVSRRSAP